MTPLDEIRKLYFEATRTTIQRDFERAIDLLKAMPSEEDRGRAAVFMEGIAEMRKEWGQAKGGGGGSRQAAPPKGSKKTRGQ